MGKWNWHIVNQMNLTYFIKWHDVGSNYDLNVWWKISWLNPFNANNRPMQNIIWWCKFSFLELWVDYWRWQLGKWLDLEWSCSWFLEMKAWWMIRLGVDSWRWKLGEWYRLGVDTFLVIVPFCKLCAYCTCLVIAPFCKPCA